MVAYSFIFCGVLVSVAIKKKTDNCLSCSGIIKIYILILAKITFIV